ncbi:endo-beta-N-acetylglucosaminidase H [Microbacterium sp. 2MCAF23]|uniref:endo-beta-N-acetylglucosaminidase H n=1 Tax=Microbacterium sp. 2MCAF23 TaxID=3232985 RepID=UPI003F9B620B
MTKHTHHLKRRTGAALAALGLALAGSLAAGGAAHAATDQPDPKRVVYVEVNGNDLSNVADYTLAGTDRPAFDAAMIFAANIDYDTEKKQAYLSLNDRVTWTLENAATQIRPLQQRGTKVLLSVLGNHQGAGLANFASRKDAGAFAQQLADTVQKYGLDGIDLDDEWSEYGKNGTGQPNASSFPYLVKELRTKLGPHKLITFYNIGPAAESTEYRGISVGALVDYALNPWYGSWDVPQLARADASKLAPGAVDLNRTPIGTAAQFAAQTKAEGYGGIVTYDLRAGDHSEYVSAITEPLTGLATEYAPTP